MMISTRYYRIFVFVCANLTVIYLVFSLVNYPSSHQLLDIDYSDPNHRVPRDHAGADRREILAHQTEVSKSVGDSTKSDTSVKVNSKFKEQINAINTSRTNVTKNKDNGDKLPQYLYDSSEDILDQDDFHNLMQERTQRVEGYCSKVRKEQLKNPSLHRIYLSTNVMYAIPNISLIWCPVYKAASTNWMHNLLHLARLSEEQIDDIVLKHPRQPNDQGRVVAPVLSTSKIRALASQSATVKLVIVRHPFDRLVSAFRDKLERCHGKEICKIQEDWYYKQYGRKIVSKYREGAYERFGPDFFSEKNNYGAPLPVSKTWRSSDMPSWWEFVQSVIQGSPRSFDEHWRPIYDYCSMCAFRYNYILHFEQIQQEESYFAESIGATDVIHPRWENRNDVGLEKSKILETYFEMLDDDEISQLYNVYRDDFELFGYTFEFRGIKYS